MEKMKRKRRFGGGGVYMGVPRFMALTSASFSTHCSQPISHAPSLFSCSHHLPHWSTVNEGKTVWEGAWDKTDPFSLDAELRQASRDTFKDEGEVNVVGRMTELQ